MPIAKALRELPLDSSKQIHCKISTCIIYIDGKDIFDSGISNQHSGQQC